MIKKISVGEYLKRYDNMNGAERSMFDAKVLLWLKDKAKVLLAKAARPEAQLQSVTQVYTGWNDEVCEVWNEGALLLSAFASSNETWLPEKLYSKAAARSIKHMVVCLTNGVSADAGAVRDAIAENKTKDATADKKEEKKDGQAAEPLKSLPSGAKPVVTRPKHIDQYIHLLPEATQKRAAKVKTLHEDLEAARHNMNVLMNSKDASAADLERWAKVATNRDTALKMIYRELDEEWTKVVEAGRVVVDDLGNARIVEPEPEKKPEPEPEKKKTGRKGAPKKDKKDLTKEEKKKVTSLQTILRDTRKGNGDGREAYAEKWKEKCRELLAIGGEGLLTASICAAAEHYGIDLEALKKEKK